MARSWARKKTLFPLLLCFILTLHLILMIFKISFGGNTELKEPGPIIVRLQDERPEFKKQIVQSEDSDNKEEKKDAFLSDKTRSFDRQTRSRVTDIFREGKEGGGRKKQGKKDVKLSDLGMEPGEDPFKEAAEEYTEAKNGNNDDDPKRKVSSTNDHLEKIPPGDITNLNTTEYKYYGFYHRIRQKLEQFWGRTLYEKAEQMASRGRRVPASEELITALRITLDERGRIVGIEVLGSSGIKELDDAAIESFNEAGPFPNPPKDLVVNGKVTLEWGFVVKS